MTVAEKLGPSDPVTDNLNDSGETIQVTESEERNESRCLILTSLLRMQTDSTWTLPSPCLPFVFS